VSRVFGTYRAIHEQGFLPIFVQDRRDPKPLVEACVEAGIGCLEFTMRNPAAMETLAWIRREHPGLRVLVGSTIPSDSIARRAQRLHPQVRTLEEFAEAGADGFVSMFGWREETIARWAPTHVVAPCAMTIREALLQLDAGAHFIKLLGPGTELVKLCRSEPTFGVCPVFQTGGITLPRVAPAVDAGAVVLGSGFDLLLAGKPSNVAVGTVAQILKRYVEAVQAARAAKWPRLAETAGLDDRTWVGLLPHVAPEIGQ
jgi:2-keto-3-deoxy-6-phosphogluconate aldolase